MDWLTVLGIVAFALGLLLSVALHEIGHLVPAKLFGVKVSQYMVGFGHTVWSRRRGETEYGVKAIPLGGYVRRVGMFPPEPGDDPRQLRRASTGPFQALIEDARRASKEEIKPGDEDRVFYRKAWWKKLIVMLGGPAMNVLIAAVLAATGGQRGVRMRDPGRRRQPGVHIRGPIDTGCRGRIPARRPAGVLRRAARDVVECGTGPDSRPCGRPR